MIKLRLATNKREHRKKGSMRPPTCKLQIMFLAIEDKDHNIKWSTSKRRQLQLVWLKEIEGFLSTKFSTPPQIKNVIYSGLHAWLQPDVLIGIQDFGTATVAMMQQNISGLRHFIRGCISI